MRRVLRVGILLRNRVGHEHRLAVAAAGVERTRGEGDAVRVECAGVARHTGGTVVVVLRVVLACPDHLHRRRRHRLRDAYAEINVVEVERQPAAEAAAEQLVVDRHLLVLEAERLGRGRTGVQRVLHAGPHVAVGAVHSGGARNRLHAGMGEERHLVVGRHHRRGRRRHLRRGAERGVERREDRLGGYAGVAAVVELGSESRQRLARAPEAVGHHDHGIFEHEHLRDAAHGFGRLRVHVHDAPTLHRGEVDRGVEHAGHTDIDPVDCAAVHLGRDVETLHRGAAQRERVGVLQRRARGDRQGRGEARQVAERGAAARGRVQHATTLRRALRRVDAELLRSRGQQHLLRGGAGHTHAVLARAADRRRAAGHLEAEPLRNLESAVVDAACHHRRDVVATQRADDVAVGILVERRGLLHAHETPVGVHLLGGHHRQRSGSALTHLAVRDEDGDQVVRRDGDPGGELAVLAGVGRDQRVAAGRQGEAGDAEQEAAARDGAGTDEGAPCPLVHDAAPSVRGAAAW